MSVDSKSSSPDALAESSGSALVSPPPGLGNNGTEGSNVATDPEIGLDGEEENRSQESTWKAWTRWPALLVSLILHTAFLLILVLWTLQARVSLDQGAVLTASNASRADLQQVELQSLPEGMDEAPPQIDPSEQSETVQDSSQQTVARLSDLLALENATQAETDNVGQFQELVGVSTLQLQSAFASTGVEGRNAKNRTQVALENGGTLESEKAVEAALKWLAEHQRPNGAWSLVHSQGSCDGRCQNDGSQDRFDTAATGLALLAFLGAGYTHQDGKYRSTVRKGVYFLIQVMEETPQGGSLLYQCDRGMYNHGIASFALCEAYQLTQDPDLKAAAQSVMDFTASAQTYRGGWGYLPQRPGDLTLSGWQIMALKSAYAADLDIRENTIMRIDRFLDSQQSEGGVFFGYTKPGKSPTCTAIGQLIRLFKGMTHTDPRVLEAADYFLRVGHSRSDVYYNYYVSLFLFHMGNPFWDQWNPQVREYLIETQSTYGHEAGSWYFDNPYGKEGGRLYTTAMCAMTLEVYYRFSPLYRQTQVKFEL